ncbi:MAG: hypothetical protein ACREL3_07540 [Gemmatimonadales bacterium]
MHEKKDPYAGLSLPDRLELLAFEAELAGFPRSLIQGLWQAIAQVLPQREPYAPLVAGSEFPSSPPRA